MKTQVRKGLLTNFRAYIIAVFGKNKFDEWLKNLRQKPAGLYSSGRFDKTWYDADEYYVEPAIALCKLAEGGRTNAVWNSGAWGVETWIKGWVGWIVDKLSPEQLIRNFLPISAVYYYRPVRVVKISVTRGEAVIYVEGMHGADSMLAYRFGGGLEKTLQIKGCKDVLVQISQSKEPFADTTVFFITWKP